MSLIFIKIVQMVGKKMSIQTFLLMPVVVPYTKNLQILLEISNTSFSTNSATAGPGGAMALYHGTDIICSELFVRNNSSGGGGGGICFLRPDNVSFNGGVFMDNISNGNSGGGIFFGTESLQDTIEMTGNI